MSRKLMLIIAVVVAVAAVSAGIAIASSSGSDDTSLTGTADAKAAAAALAYTKGGTVVESEAGDDGAAYEVEVRLANGKVVDVELDANYAVIGQAAGDDGQGDDDSRAGDNDD
jgi:hypothetical protein